jgi:hypothetical protein
MSCVSLVEDLHFARPIAELMAAKRIACAKVADLLA